MSKTEGLHEEEEWIFEYYVCKVYLTDALQVNGPLAYWARIANSATESRGSTNSGAYQRTEQGQFAKL